MTHGWELKHVDEDHQVGGDQHRLTSTFASELCHGAGDTWEIARI